MIKAVFLDFYGTLARWSPPAEAIQAEACAAEGVSVDEAALARGYLAGDAYMAEENAHAPISARPEAERRAFFAEYERQILGAAGVEVTAEKAGLIWERVDAAPKELRLYEDARPALQELVAAGLKTGIISNMGREQLAALVDRLDLAGLVHVWVSSGDAGVNKPHPAIFEAALAKAGVAAAEAMHVGDHYEGDVVGAQNAHLEALWLVRTGPGDGKGGPPKITTLRGVLPHLHNGGYLGTL